MIFHDCRISKGGCGASVELLLCYLILQILKSQKLQEKLGLMKPAASQRKKIPQMMCLSGRMQTIT